MKKSLFLVVFLTMLLTGCKSEPAFDDAEYKEYFSKSNPVVVITVKDMGEMTLELFPDVAPNSVNNFIAYIQNKDYSGTTFHRVIEGFMIQGGIIDNTSCPIAGEFSSNGFANDLSHYRGVISMARTSVKNSATIQFFIMHQDSFHLDGNYAAFGGLTRGANILDEIAAIATGSADNPLLGVIIESITVDLNGYDPDEPVCAN